MIEIRKAAFPEDLESVLTIYREYIDRTIADLSFQNNEEEFKQLPQHYGSAGAGIYLARANSKIIGCAAFRKIDTETCEMKRVFVRPEARGRGAGAGLVHKVIEEARQSGYLKICLDVLPEFDIALRLYESCGFVTDKPVTHNPIPGTRFLALRLF